MRPLMHSVARLRALAVLAVLALVVSCGSTEPTAVPIEQTTFNPTLHIDLAAFTKLPSGMYVRDSVVGTGAAFASGHSVTARYVGYLADGSRFDQGTYTFTLGAGQVIPGWDIGLQGMKVGGTRRLIIPPELAYGAAGNGPIPPFAVLVFNVDAVSTQ